MSGLLALTILRQFFGILMWFVHPGLDDAMPVSIVEALMCGVPCVSTKVGDAGFSTGRGRGVSD